MIRPLNKFVKTYNSEAKKYLQQNDFMLNQLENGRYLFEYNNFVPLMFDYCRFCISKKNLTETANNSLDFIIVNT